MEVYDLSEENELDTYMSREVPVRERDEAKSLTQEELDQGIKHIFRCRFEVSVLVLELADLGFVRETLISKTWNI